MPIYEFICLSCGKNFEELVRSDNEKIRCPNCSSEEIKKNISLCGLKGNPGSKTCPVTCKGTNCSSCK